MRRTDRPVVEETRRTTRSTRRRSESGDTLVEVLLALIVLSIASIALIIAFGTSISASSEHRQLSATGIVLDSVSQQVISAMQSTPALFNTCASFATYQSDVMDQVTIPAPYTSEYSVAFSTDNPIEYWDPTNTPVPGFIAAANCTSEEYNQSQQIAITLTQLSNGRTYTNSFVVDSPLDGLASTSGQASETGVAAQLVFTTQPVGGATGAQLATQPVVTVEDSSGNIVTNDLSPVILSVTGNGVAVTGCAGTEVSGVVTFTGCTIGTAGVNYTLTASDTEITSGGPFVSAAFSVSTAADYLTFSQEPIGGPSGGLMGQQPVVTVDRNGSRDYSWTGTITLTSSGGDLAGCASVATTNGQAIFANCTFAGVYYFNQSSKVFLATPYTLTATASNSTPTSPTTSITVEVTSAGTAYQLEFATQPTGAANINPSTAFATQPVVDVEDSFGNIVTTSSASVKLAISSGTLTCAQNPLSVYNATVGFGGNATFSNCGGSATGTGLTLSATSAGLVTATSASFNITGVAIQLIFTVEPVAGVSGTSLTTMPVLTFEDASGNVVTAETNSVTLTPSGGALTLCTNLAPNGGVVSVATCVFSGVVGTPYTMTATAGTSPNQLSVVSSFFSPSGAGTGTQLVFTTPPVAGSAGSLLATQPVVSIEDSGGNVTTSSATISLSTSGGTLSSCSNLTAVNGVVGVANCTFGGTFGTYTMTATSPGMTFGSVPFTLSLPGPASTSTSTVTASPTSVSTLGSATSTVTVTLEDTYGNPIAGKTIALTGENGSSVVTALSSTTNSLGQANFSVSDTTAETVTYAATDTTDAVPLSATAAVIFFGPPTQVVLTSACSPSVASSVSCSTTATLEDANGSVVTNYNGPVVFSQTSGSGSVTGLSGVANFTNGVASVNLTGDLVGPVTIDALGDTFTSNSVTFNVTVGAPSQLVLSGCATSLASATSCSATATLEDANGNVESAYNTTLSFNQTGGSGSITGTGTASFTNGVASVNLTGNKVGTVSVDAVGDGITSNAINFSVTPGTPTQVVLSGCSTSLASAKTCSATATLEDANNNTVTTYNGAVAFNQTGSGSVTGTGASSFINGVATVTLTGDQVGSVTITAVGDGFTSNSNTFNVTAGTAAQIVLSGCGSNIASGLTCVVTATLEDANGNTVSSNVAVTFNQSGAGSVTGTGATTFSNGVKSVTLTGNLVGAVTITAVGDGFTSNPVGFNVTVGPAAKVVMSGCASSIASGSTCVATAIVEDANGNTVAYNGTGTFAATGTGSVTGTGSATFTNGVGSDTVTGNLVGSVTIKATADLFTAATGDTFNVTAGPASPSTSTVVAVPTSVVANGTATSTITVTLRDANGNPVAGKTITLAGNSGTHSTITPATATTSATGVASFTVKDTTAEPVTYTATDTSDTVTLNTTPTVTFTAGNAAKVVMSGCASSIASGSTCVATATVEDANGNTVAYNGTGTFAATGTGSVTGTGSATFTNGVGSDTVTGNLVGSVTIKATADLFTAATGDAFNVTAGPANAYTSSALASDTSVIANGTAISTITVTLRDANGNPVAGKTITLAGNSGTHSTITTVVGTTSATGVASFTVKDTTAEPVTYTAKDTSDSVTIIDTAPVNFYTPYGVSNVTSTVSATATFLPLSTSTTIGNKNNHSTTITVTLTDAYGNPVAGKTITLAGNSGTRSTIATVVGTTSATGVATFTVFDETAEPVTYTATDTTDAITLLSTTVVNYYTATSTTVANAAASTVSATDTSVIDNGTTTTITVTLLSESGSQIKNKVITLTGSGGTHSTITTVSGTTNTSGVATFTVKDSTPEAVTYSAMDTTDSIPITDTAMVNFYALPLGSTASSTVAALDTSVVADGTTTTTITVTLLDAEGNPVVGKAISLTASAGTNSTITTVSGTTNASGVATFTVSDATAEAVTYTARDTTDGLTLIQTPSVNFYD